MRRGWLLEDVARKASEPCLNSGDLGGWALFGAKLAAAAGSHLPQHLLSLVHCLAYKYRGFALVACAGAAEVCVAGVSPCARAGQTGDVHREATAFGNGKVR